MAFSAGVYTLPTNSFAQPVTGTTISSSGAVSLFADFVTAFSTCLLKDGTQTVTANIPMSSFKFTGLAAGSANGDSLRYEQLFSTSAVTLLGEVRYTAGATISAAGTDQSGATQLTATINRVTTVAASSGVKLYASPAAGSWQVVYNGGANTLRVYPQTSGTLNQLSANTAMLLATNTAAIYFAASTTAWIAFLSA